MEKNFALREPRQRLLQFERLSGLLVRLSTSRICLAASVVAAEMARRSDPQSLRLLSGEAVAYIFLERRDSFRRTTTLQRKSHRCLLESDLALAPSQVHNWCLGPLAAPRDEVSSKDTGDE